MRRVFIYVCICLFYNKIPCYDSFIKKPANQIVAPRFQFQDEYGMDPNANYSGFIEEGVCIYDDRRMAIIEYIAQRKGWSGYTRHIRIKFDGNIEGVKLITCISVRHLMYEYFDDDDVQDFQWAAILTGGVGYNYTVIDMHANESHPIYFNVTIIGQPRYHFNIGYQERRAR